MNWTKQFDTFCFLDSHNYQIPPYQQEWMLAAGVRRKISAQAGTAITSLQSFINEEKSWLFGHLSYDLKNELENMSSAHADLVQFPDLFFFEPEILIRCTAEGIHVHADDPAAIFQSIQQTSTHHPSGSQSLSSLQSRLSRNEYIDVIHRLQDHILRGDCYEINFCQEFFCSPAVVDPVHVYEKLAALSPNPFSALYRVNDQWLICASPERFIRKENERIISQPIKGTSRRHRGNIKADERSREDLMHSSKDRSENVMVVDLVRNDLAKLCEEGSVKVDELYGVYSFPQVHQMISTISGRLLKGISFEEIIRASFPMGSMTGAPKIRVMELIEKYEVSRRGIFSGAVGYLDPEGNFDFNVVIRSIMYNQASQYLSVQAGSGITYYSEALSEWDECMAKAEAMQQALQ